MHETQLAEQRPGLFAQYGHIPPVQGPLAGCRTERRLTGLHSFGDLQAHQSLGSVLQLQQGVKSMSVASACAFLASSQGGHR